MDVTSKVALNGERSNLLINEQNGVVGQVSSPSSSGRREIVSRHVLSTCITCFILLYCFGFLM